MDQLFYHYISGPIFKLEDDTDFVSASSEGGDARVINAGYDSVID